jgi:methionine sulfoxide reductase catalytic subunit
VAPGGAFLQFSPPCASHPQWFRDLERTSRFYWNDHCTPGSEWLKFTKKQRPKDRLWTASDEESSFPSAIALPGHENLGLGRHWHFLADFAWLLTGLVYEVMLFVTPEWRRWGIENV